MNTTYEFAFNHVCVARARVALSTYELSELWVDVNERRKGLGRRMMKLVCDEADRERVVLKLIAATCGGMTNEQLKAWYKRFGFEHDPLSYPWMRRTPRIR